jgi:hypothetical protein
MEVEYGYWRTETKTSSLLRIALYDHECNEGIAEVNIFTLTLKVFNSNILFECRPGKTNMFTKRY